MLKDSLIIKEMFSLCLLPEKKEKKERNTDRQKERKKEKKKTRRGKSVSWQYLFEVAGSRKECTGNEEPTQTGI